MIRALALAAVAALASPALAQVPPPGASTLDIHRYQLDQHRAAMAAQSRQSQLREMEARQAQFDARLTRFEVEARRPSALPDPLPPIVIRSPEQERAYREAATARRETRQQAMGQIDAWLDRRPD